MELETGAVQGDGRQAALRPRTRDDCGANRNVATQDRFPPGSTMKVVTAAAALDSGKYKPDSQVDGTNGKEISGAPLDNFGGEDFGQIDLTDGADATRSTPSGRSVAEELGKETMAEYMEKFGFYEDPPMDYPDSQMIPSGVNKGRRRLVPPTSDRVDIGRVAIGQGDLEATRAADGHAWRRRSATAACGWSRGWWPRSSTPTGARSTSRCPRRPSA